MAKQIYYICCYPSISTVIEKTETEYSFYSLRNIYGPKAIISDTWEKVHDQLIDLYKRKVEKAKKDLDELLHTQKELSEMKEP